VSIQYVDKGCFYLKPHVQHDCGSDLRSRLSHLVSMRVCMCVPVCILRLQEVIQECSIN